MKNPIERKINNWLNQMFDSYYQVSVLASLPGNADFEEVLANSGKTALKLKHQAASIAVATLQAGRPLYKEEERVVLKDMARQFANNACNTVEVLEVIFKDLLDEIVQLN